MLRPVQEIYAHVQQRKSDDDNNLFVKAHVLKSFSSASNSGIPRPAVVLFREGIPIKGYCDCPVGLSGLCCLVICLLIYLEHYTSHGVKFLALTYTQKIQKWHRKGTNVQFQKN